MAERLAASEMIPAAAHIMCLEFMFLSSLSLVTCMLWLRGLLRPTVSCHAATLVRATPARLRTALAVLGIVLVTLGHARFADFSASSADEPRVLATARHVTGS